MASTYAAGLPEGGPAGRCSGHPHKGGGAGSDTARAHDAGRPADLLHLRRPMRPTRTRPRSPSARPGPAAARTSSGQDRLGQAGADIGGRGAGLAAAIGVPGRGRSTKSDSRCRRVGNCRRGPRRPGQRISLDDHISYALLVVLETLTPAERTSWVLHDLFGMSFSDVADSVGREPPRRSGNSPPAPTSTRASRGWRSPQPSTMRRYAASSP